MWNIPLYTLFTPPLNSIQGKASWPGKNTGPSHPAGNSRTGRPLLSRIRTLLPDSVRLSDPEWKLRPKRSHSSFLAISLSLHRHPSVCIHPHSWVLSLALAFSIYIKQQSLALVLRWCKPVTNSATSRLGVVNPGINDTYTTRRTYH
jgi:hypothetical protein